MLLIGEMSLLIICVITLNMIIFLFTSVAFKIVYLTSINLIFLSTGLFCYLCSKLIL